MKTPPYWNHNTAYYPWIKRKIAPCRSVLDVGCGDGALLAFLDEDGRQLCGIDTDPTCIARARRANRPEAVFAVCDFAEWETARQYDAVIFVASLHHMDMQSAIQKAKRMLAPDGILLVVGLAKPSTVWDWCIEILRVLPSGIVSACRHMQTTEEKNIPVSYHFPTLREVRKIRKAELPAAALRQGLHYRYLLSWTKKDG